MTWFPSPHDRKDFQIRVDELISRIETFRFRTQEPYLASHAYEYMTHLRRILQFRVELDFLRSWSRKEAQREADELRSRMEERERLPFREVEALESIAQSLSFIHETLHYWRTHR